MSELTMAVDFLENHYIKIVGCAFLTIILAMGGLAYTAKVVYDQVQTQQIEEDNK